MNVTTGGDASGRADFLPTQGYFDQVGKAFGPVSTTLAFGGMRMRLEGLGQKQSDFLRRRFGPFLTDEDEEPEVSVLLRRAGVDGFLSPRSDGLPETYRLGTRREGTRLELWSYEFAGWVDWVDRRAAVSLVSSSGARFTRGLENFLRALTASFILDRGGFLLHAAGIVRGNRAYVFFGPSGSGKSTVTRLSPENMVLSDDLTLVIERDGRYEAAGIPFGMAHHRVPDTLASFPIASFNRLVKSDAVDRTPITGACAVAELACSLPFVMDHSAQVERAMDVVGRAVARVPVHRLRFRKDDSFWSVVEEA